MTDETETGKNEHYKKMLALKGTCDLELDLDASREDRPLPDFKNEECDEI